MENIIASIPLDELISTEVNMYELTNAAIHRARQLSMTGLEEIESAGGKVVSLAISEIVTGEVQYTLKKD